MKKLLSLITISILFISALNAQLDEVIFKKALKKLEFDTISYTIYGNNITSVRLSENSKAKYNKSTNSKVVKLLRTIDNLESQLSEDKGLLIKDVYPFHLKSDYRLEYVEQYLNRSELEVYTQEVQIHKDLYKIEVQRIKNEVANQKANTKKSNSQGLYKYRMRELSGHNYLSHFYNRELNFAQNRLTGFIDEFLDLSEVYHELNNNKLVCRYKSKVSSGTPETLEIIFDVYTKDDHLYYINKVNVSGSYKSVIDLFVMYWPTKLNANDTKVNEWAYYSMLPDRVGFYVDDYKKARIEIGKSPNVNL